MWLLLLLPLPECPLAKFPPTEYTHTSLRINIYINVILAMHILFSCGHCCTFDRTAESLQRMLCRRNQIDLIFIYINEDTLHHK